MKQTIKSIDPADYRAAYPFAAHFLDRSGLAYHYVDEGQGAPVVMVHGNPTWSFFFAALSAICPAAIAPSRRITWGVACRTSLATRATNFVSSVEWPISMP